MGGSVHCADIETIIDSLRAVKIGTITQAEFDVRADEQRSGWAGKQERKETNATSVEMQLTD